jgi:hypothetical protein
VSRHPSGLTAQQIAAKVSGENRSRRTRERKEREAKIAALPPCPECGGKATSITCTITFPGETAEKYLCNMRNKTGKPTRNQRNLAVISKGSTTPTGGIRPHGYLSPNNYERRMSQAA